MRHTMTRIFRALITAALMASAPPAIPCGLEDRTTVAIGALNFAYPDALHVGTAVWQAQQAGLLPRPLPWADSAQARQAQLWEILRLLDRLSKAWPTDASMPPVAVVFVGNALWSRLLTHEGARVMQPHVAGPEPGDLVMVTDPLVLQAWLEGRLDGAALITRGVVRLYGELPAQAAVAAALAHGPEKT